MKKVSLLVGTLGGAMAGYLFSNKKLRDELSDAKDAEAAAKVLGKHLQKDGKKLGKQLQEFVESEDVQQNLTKAKQFTKKKYDEAKDEIQGLACEGKERCKNKAKKVGTKAKTAARSATKKGKTQAKKSVKKATKAAKKTGKRVSTKVRSLS